MTWLTIMWSLGFIFDSEWSHRCGLCHCVTEEAVAIFFRVFPHFVLSRFLSWLPIEATCLRQADCHAVDFVRQLNRGFWCFPSGTLLSYGEPLRWPTRFYPILYDDVPIKLTVRQLRTSGIRVLVSQSGCILDVCVLRTCYAAFVEVRPFVIFCMEFSCWFGGSFPVVMSAVISRVTHSVIVIWAG